MRKLAVVMAMVAALGSQAVAGSLKTDQVAGDAKWVAHVDVEGIIACDVGQFVLSQAKKHPKFSAGLVVIRKLLGFDPLKDLRGVTLYGKEFAPHSAVAVLDATINEEDVLELIKANPAYKRLTYGKYVLHQWTDKKKGKLNTPVGCFQDEDTVVVSDRVELVQHALDVLDGKAASLKKTGAVKDLPTPSYGTLMLAAVSDFCPPAEALAKDKAGLLKKIAGGSIQIAENDGRMCLHLAVRTKDAKDAEYMRQAAQGIIAFAQLMRDTKQVKILCALGLEAKVGGEGTTACLKASMPTESVIKVMQHKMKEKAGKRAKRKDVKDKAHD